MMVNNNSGHSALVKIQLLIAGGCSSIPVAQLGPDFLLLDHPFDHPPGNGLLVLQVDQNKRQWNVELPSGICASSARVPIKAQR